MAKTAITLSCRDGLCPPRFVSTQSWGQQFRFWQLPWSTRVGRRAVDGALGRAERLHVGARLAGGMRAHPRPATHGPAPVAAVGDECRVQAGTACASPLEWAWPDRELTIGRNATRPRIRRGSAARRLTRRNPEATALPNPESPRPFALPLGRHASFCRAGMNRSCRPPQRVREHDPRGRMQPP